MKYFISLVLLSFVSSSPNLFQQTTNIEKEAIKELRELLGTGVPYENEYKPYMSKDEFLIRFLRDQNLNVDKTRSKIIKMLEWRKEKNIDGILTATMGNLPKLFPYELEGIDYDGNPLLLVPYGGWDVRKFIVRGGGRESLALYSAQLLERGANKMRKLNASYARVIIDMNGYNARQHGCAACIPFYYDLLTQFELYYPAHVKSFDLINTPKIWETVSKILLPLLSSNSKEIILIYGYNKRDWQQELLKSIPSDQLPPRYGGTKGMKMPNSVG